tara:strand:- start:7 stop:1179 length:1173 start_codon:yes stop_codon:yes gene_type:complete
MKYLLKNFVLFSISIFSPIYLIGIFDFFLNGEYEKIKNEKIEMDAKIDLINKKGVVPTFYPVETVTEFFEKFSKKNFYPIGSLPKKNSYLCDEGYGLIEYKTDRFGLRNQDKNWDKAHDSNTIFFIGDSFTMGFCVEDEQTIPGITEIISKKNVLNLGFGGNGPTEYIALLRTIIEPVLQKTSSENNHVVIIFYANDNFTNNSKFLNLSLNSKKIATSENKNRFRPYSEYVQTIEDIIYSEYPINDGKEEIISTMRNSKNLNIFYKLTTMYTIRQRLNSIISSKKVLKEKHIFAPEINQSISFLSKICKVNCTPHIIFIPSKLNRKDKEKEALFFNYVEKLALQVGINIIDGRIVLDASLLENYSPSAVNAHLSPEGYRKIAELFLENIR